MIAAALSPEPGSRREDELASAIRDVFETRTREAVLVLRAALRIRLGAARTQTLGELLNREPLRAAGIQRLLLLTEYAAFAPEALIARAVDDLELELK